MTELAALNVKINGDASGLQGALNVAEGGLERVGAQAQQTQQQVLATSTGMGRLGQVFQRNGFAISNAANQFSDLAVQIGMGVPASRALSQQLPQMTAFMGPLAAIIGVTSGVLIGLAGNFLAASDNAQTLEDALEGLESINSRLSQSNDILSMSVFELTAKYGAYADEVRRAAESVASLSQAEAAQRLASAIADVDEALDGFTQRSGSAFRSGTMMITAIGNIAEQFGISREEARLLEVQFRALETATTFEDQVTALRAIEDLMEQTGANAADLPPELIEALRQLNQMVIASAEVEAGLNSAAKAGANLRRSLPMTTGGIGPGIYNPDGSLALPPPPGDVYGDGDGDGGGSVGGVGISLADQIERDLERLREGFMTEEELQVEAYARQQEILQAALEQRLLTQEEYNALMRDAENAHSLQMAQIKQNEAAMISSAQAGMYNELSGLLGMFASKSKAAAIAQIALNKGLRIAEIIQNTAAAQMRALAELGPIAGAAAAAKIGAYGKIQAGIVAATGLAQAGGVLSSGSATTVASTASSTAGATAAPSTSRNVAISLQGGDMFSRDQVINLINSINEAIEDGAIVRLV